MEIKTMITAIISAVVALIIVVVVAVPIISNVTEDVNTVQYNDAPRFFAENAVDEIVTYTVDASGQIEYNGIGITGLTDDDGLAPVAISESFLLLYNISNPVLHLYENNESVGALLNFTLNPDGTYSYIKNDNTTGSGTYETIINADPNGEYAAIQGGTQITVNVDKDKPAYLYNRVYSSNTGNIHYTGEYLDGEFTQLYTVSGTTTTVTHNPPTVEENRLHDTLIFENKIYADDTGLTGVLVVIVPYEYHTITASDDAIVSMINVVPLLMIVGIIIAVTAMFIRTR